MGKALAPNGMVLLVIGPLGTLLGLSSLWGLLSFSRVLGGAVPGCQRGVDLSRGHLVWGGGGR